MELLTNLESQVKSERAHQDKVCHTSQVFNAWRITSDEGQGKLSLIMESRIDSRTGVGNATRN